MQVKNELRKKYKEIRKNVENRNEKNTLINDFLCNSDCFKNCDTVLFYAALSDEVNLDFSIKYAIDNNKKVALPVCIDNNGKMQYYYIDSLNDIEIASFGVREPDVNKCKEVDDFSNSICIVPAIAYDKFGYRLGYGKGYYDRFLSAYHGICIGVQYDELVCDKLFIDKYDVPVDYIITQNGVFSTKLGGKNG